MPIPRYTNFKIISVTCVLSTYKGWGGGGGYGIYRHFQKYFCYMVAVSFIGGGKRIPGENH